MARDSYRHGHLREALVREAVALMTERADASFTLREVAKRIGVSHSAAYRHFASKGALLAEIARQGFDILTDALRATFATGRPPERVLEDQARAYVRTAVANPAHFRCMFGPRRFADEEAAPVDEACELSYGCLLEATGRLLGDQADEAAIEGASLVMWSLVHGIASLAIDGQLGECVSGESAGEFEDLARDAWGRLLHGLAPR